MGIKFIPDNCPEAYTVTGVLVHLALFLGTAYLFMNSGPSKKKPRAGRKSASDGKKFIVGGNWKCETDSAKVTEIVSRLNKMGPLPYALEVYVSPPSPHLGTVTTDLRTDIAVSSQDCGNLSKYGAFTGEAFAGMLMDVGCEWALLGHSERRSYQKESSELIANKAAAAIAQGLGVVVCIGEPLEVREAGIPALKQLLLDEQMTALVKVVGKDAKTWSQIVIAYEPVWAIGTGKTATPTDAQETHKIIRDWVSKTCGAAIANDLRIQYGGSVKGASAAALAAQPDIDGFLVGGSSLKDDFLDIVANSVVGLAARK